MSFCLVTIIAEHVNAEKIVECNEEEIIINHNQIKRINHYRGLMYKPGCLMETCTGSYVIQESFESMKAELLYAEDEIIGDIPKNPEGNENA